MRSRSSITLPLGILLPALLAGCVAAAPRQGDAAHPYVRDTAYTLLGLAAQALLTSDPTSQQNWTFQFGGNMAQWTETRRGGFGTSQCYINGAQQWCTNPQGPGP